ncbi:MAG: hypothetical protein JYX80_11450 [Candidatus Scalindua sediminis]|nr:hypothetical protein [Candidatus Scalindua sediminis]
MSNKSFTDRMLSLIDDVSGGNQKKFARIIDVKYTTVNSWFKKGSLPSHEHYRNIRENIGANINWLLTGVGLPYLKEGTHGKLAEEQGEYIKKPEPEEERYISKLMAILQGKNEAIKELITCFLDTIASNKEWINAGRPERRKKKPSPLHAGRHERRKRIHSY